MAAYVDERLQAAIVAAHDEQRYARGVVGDEVTWARELGGMADGKRQPAEEERDPAFELCVIGVSAGVQCLARRRRVRRLCLDVREDAPDELDLPLSVHGAAPSRCR